MVIALIDRILDNIKYRICRWLNPACKTADEWVGQYRGIFLILMLLQITAYSYFYTTITFSNHTFPNIWLYQYPSFKTRGEGRWLADLIILAQGGSGVQSFQMICATALQAFNGILLAQFLGLREKRTILCIAAVLCMYPAFLDYYSFSVDHITFVLGDSFALLGALSFVKNRTFWGRIVGASSLFLLAIAAYQPKIALVSFLASSALLLRFTKTHETTAEISPMREAIIDTMAMAVTFSLALGLYWLTTKIVITLDLGNRVHLNTPSEVIGEIIASYPKTLTYFTTRSAGIPHSLQFLPAIGIVLGVTVVLREAWQKGAPIFFMALVILALMPITLRACYVTNNLSWQDTGRIVSANGYFLVFFLGYGLRVKILRGFSAAAAVICLYFFIILATQESNAAAFKTMYDINIINRIAARAEMVLGAPTESQWALVVAGHYPDFNRTQYVRYPNETSTAHIQSFAFEVYRQSKILNFFIGRNVFRQPTKDELNRAIESMRNKKPWPSSESVYVLNNILIVLLEPYRPDMPVTWAKD
jgi:hypothetical protein